MQLDRRELITGVAASAAAALPLPAKAAASGLRVLPVIDGAIITRHNTPVTGCAKLLLNSLWHFQPDARPVVYSPCRGGADLSLRAPTR
jgi:hypothetical protein